MNGWHCTACPVPTRHRGREGEGGSREEAGNEKFPMGSPHFILEFELIFPTVVQDRNSNETECGEIIEYNFMTCKVGLLKFWRRVTMHC